MVQKQLVVELELLLVLEVMVLEPVQRVAVELVVEIELVEVFEQLMLLVLLVEIPVAELVVLVLTVVLLLVVVSESLLEPLGIDHVVHQQALAHVAVAFDESFVE